MLGALKQRLRAAAREHGGPRLLARLPRRVDLPHDAFGLHVGESGHLHLGHSDLVDLVAEYGSPLHVVVGTRLDAQADAALSNLRAPGCAGADFFYSYKTNPVPATLARLHAAGIGAEVISEFELWLAFELGVPPERVIYNGPAKSHDSIRTAIERGVLLVNANSASDVDTITRIAGEVGKVAPLGLRVSLPGMWGGQFGISAESPLLDDIVLRSVADTRVDLVAVHAHRGGTIRTRDDLVGHVSQVLEFLAELRARTGWFPSIVDLGGSLACPTVGGFSNREFRLNRFLGSDIQAPDPADTLGLADASALAAAMVGEHATSLGEPEPLVVLEPGRAVTANTQFLLTTVVDVKDDVEPFHAVLDAGINVAETAAHEFHQLFSASKPTDSAETSYRLAGPICTPADVLYNNWRLPKLDAGHVLAIMDTGAYFVPFSTSFSFPRPAIVMVDDAGVRLVRERERFTDIVRLDIEPVRTPSAAGTGDAARDTGADAP